LDPLPGAQPGQRGDLRDLGAVGDHRGHGLAALAPDGLRERFVEDLGLGQFEVPQERIGLGQVVSTVDLQQRFDLVRLGLETDGGGIGHGAPYTPAPRGVCSVS